GPVEIFDQVVRVFEADRQADRARADARFRERRVAHAKVRGARRVDHQRLRIADVGEVRKNSQRLDKAPAGGPVALQVEAEYRAAAARKKALREGVVRMRRQLGIGNRFDRGLLAAQGDQLARLLQVFVHAQG